MLKLIIYFKFSVTKVIYKRTTIKTNIMTYYMRIEVRDKNGKLIRDENGNVRTNLNTSVLEHELVVIENIMRSHKKTLQAWMPENKITIEVGYRDSISSTCPVLFCLTDEKFSKF